MYRSPTPLTYTYLPLWTETPGIFLTAEAISLAPEFFMLSSDNPSISLTEFRCKCKIEASVFLFKDVVIITSSNLAVDAFKVTSTIIVSPFFTITSFISSVWYPTNENCTVYIPGFNSKEYLPSKSLSAPRCESFIITFANGNMSLYSPSLTVPVIIPDCAKVIKDNNPTIIVSIIDFFIVVL